MRLQSSDNFLNTTNVISLGISTPRRITLEEIVWTMVDGMEAHIGVLAYLFGKRLANLATRCALLFVKVPCHAVQQDLHHIRMTGLDIETVSLLNRLKH